MSSFSQALANYIKAPIVWRPVGGTTFELAMLDAVPVFLLGTITEPDGPAEAVMFHLASSREFTPGSIEAGKELAELLTQAAQHLLSAEAS